MSGRKPLAESETRAKVLDLIGLFGIKELAGKLEVHLSTVYRWSSYSYSVYPNPEHKRRMLRLWYYYACNHKGRGNHAAQDATNELNYEEEGVAVHA